MELTGSMLKKAICAGAVALERESERIDELNVYPVPDGDTGTNMARTLAAARRALLVIDDNASVSSIADRTAAEMLRSARGNSGVILALLQRGFAKGLRELEDLSTADIANALEVGVQTAYKAVMQPTEGTILTVARLAAQQAQISSRTTKDLVPLWEDICKAAKKALADTPTQLPVLARAGVVDAGGQGLVVLYEAMLEVFMGETVLGTPPSEDEEQENLEFDSPTIEEITQVYCTEFVIKRSEKSPDPFRLRAFLETIGECVLVVEDEDILKIHCHTNHPGEAIEKALEFGELCTDPLPRIENMRQQAEMRAKRNRYVREEKSDYPHAEPEKAFGFVAVAMGEGIEQMFHDLGADIVLHGGQSKNPSTEDLLRAIHSVPAQTVFVLPNNKNIILAAEQAVLLADRRVCVLQTRTIPQGISALLAFDDKLDLSGNRIAMTKAFEHVSTGQVTLAAKDANLEGRAIKKGEVLCFDNGTYVFSDRDCNRAALRLTKHMVCHETSYLTVMYGEGVPATLADQLVTQLQRRYGDRIEIMLMNGGQPLYSYLIAVE